MRIKAKWLMYVKAVFNIEEVGMYISKMYVFEKGSVIDLEEICNEFSSVLGREINKDGFWFDVNYTDGESVCGEYSYDGLLELIS